MRSQVVGEDRSRLLGEEQLVKLEEEEDEEGEPARTKERIHKFRV